MKEVTVQEFEKNFDTYMDRIETGVEFWIRQADGRGVVAMPAKQREQALDDIGDNTSYNVYNNHDDAS